MNRLIHFQKTTPLLVVACALACFGFLPQTQAVVPPPDGCYPNFTTAEGCEALNFLTTGAGNTGLGWRSLFSNTDASFNTAVGGGALALSNADSNTAVGAATLLLNTTGTENTAVGTDALVNNDIGSQNTATGAFALFSNTGSTNNPNRPSSAPGTLNTANGARALFNNTSGAANTAIGTGALTNNIQGTNNTALGAFAGDNVTNANSVIAIGTNGQNVSNSCFIGQIYSNIQPQVGTDPDLVTINSSGRLGRANVSSRRYKHDIQPMDKASEALYGLRPVSFRYYEQYDATQTIAFGLIAEDVAKVCPDLVGRNPKGEPESVRYQQINAMLLNEFLKEHKAFVGEQRKVQEQGATIVRLQKQIEALTAGLQKVSAQLEASKPARQVANNP